VPASGRLDAGEGCATAGGGVLLRDRATCCFLLGVRRSFGRPTASYIYGLDLLLFL
jgi:hypothetical protein